MSKLNAQGSASSNLWSAAIYRRFWDAIVFSKRTSLGHWTFRAVYWIFLLLFVAGGHNGIHATHLAPDALRYLWKGWPGEPIKPAAQHRNHFLRELLIPGKPFEVVMEVETAKLDDNKIDFRELLIEIEGEAGAPGPGFAVQFVSDGKGGIHVLDRYDSTVPRFIDSEGKVTPGIPGVLAFGANGSVLVEGMGEQGMLLYPDGYVGKGEPIVCKHGKNFLCPYHVVPLRNGRFYATGIPSGSPSLTGIKTWAVRKMVWLIEKDGSILKEEVLKGGSVHSGVLAVDASGQWLYSFDSEPSKIRVWAG